MLAVLALELLEIVQPVASVEWVDELVAVYDASPSDREFGFVHCPSSALILADLA